MTTQQAFKQGQEARSKGIKAPIHDKNFWPFIVELFDNKNNKEAVKLMKAWNKGATSESLKPFNFEK
jgi:hypothetical protein